jgi:hypothetical protein
MRIVRRKQKMLEIGRLTGKAGEVPSLQQREKTILGKINTLLLEVRFQHFHAHGEQRIMR